mmetsp:Transcript_11702/g.19468  ORF Transcript_11702/g.19468 Transcript_11702/m.19468 type:complete len:80 (+) Transcript_11702:1217-1456(+)
MAAIECLRQGADPVRTHLTFSTLRNMETTIKTSFGEDAKKVGGTHDVFAIGLGRQKLQKCDPSQGYLAKATDRHRQCTR